MPPKRNIEATIDENGCWKSNIPPNVLGYCDVKHTKTNSKLHRLVYEALIGPIPEKLVLDHLCRNRWCCNPWHLEPVPQSVNVWRGDVPKTTAVEVENARVQYANNELNLNEVAAQLHVAPSTASLIMRGDLWPMAGGPFTRARRQRIRRKDAAKVRELFGTGITSEEAGALCGVAPSSVQWIWGSESRKRKRIEMAE